MKPVYVPTRGRGVHIDMYTFCRPKVMSVAVRDADYRAAFREGVNDWRKCAVEALPPATFAVVCSAVSAASSAAPQTGYS